MTRLLFIVSMLAWTLLPAKGAVFTLSCDGAMISGSKQEPISNMGLIVNLDVRTVTGFSGIVAQIDRINENWVIFKGSTSDGWYIEGSLDRITGNVRANKMLTDSKANSNLELLLTYSLTCQLTKPSDG
jgi:hypothetical protein